MSLAGLIVLVFKLFGGYFVESIEEKERASECFFPFSFFFSSCSVTDGWQVTLWPVSKQ